MNLTLDGLKRRSADMAITFVITFAALLCAAILWAASPSHQRAFVCGAIAAPPNWERCTGRTR